MGWLTMEELWWSDDGALRTHAPSTYKIPTARDVAGALRASTFFDRPEPRGRRSTARKAVGRAAAACWRSRCSTRIRDARRARSATRGACRALDAPATPEAILRAIDAARRPAARRCPGARPGDRALPAWRLRPTRALPPQLASAPRGVLVCVAHAPAARRRARPARRWSSPPTPRIGTIGGGKLEFEALSIARDALAGPARPAPSRTSAFRSAASVGQCCGGVATLAFARSRRGRSRLGRRRRRGAGDAASPLRWSIGLAAAAGAPDGASPPTTVDGSLGAAALDAAAIALARARLAAADAGSARATVEPRRGRSRSLLHLPGTAAFDVLLFGNGHVGRALAQVLRRAAGARALDRRARGGLSRRDPAGNVEIVATDAARGRAARGAPPAPRRRRDAQPCARFRRWSRPRSRATTGRYLGMIGSRAKRAQLERRLAARGLPPDAIGARRCPIGAAAGLPRGKEPGIIAVAVAAEMLARARARGAASAAAPVSPSRWRHNRAHVRRADHSRPRLRLSGITQGLSRRSSPTTASTSRCCPARSTPCWARTAPASRR